jgi:riboflavin biosynthesis pyrimidine reductase
VRRLLPEPSDDVDLAAAYACPEGHPWLRANMVTSVDGAMTGPDARSGSLSGPADRAVFRVLRRAADAVLVGAGTVRAEGYRPAALPIAVVSNRLDLDWSLPLFDNAPQRTLVLTSAAAPADRLAAARVGTDVVLCGEERVDPALAVAALHQRGLTRLLCEGGPSLLAQLGAAGLLDELCLTTAPVLVGGTAGRILAGPELDGRPWHLAHLLTDEDSLFARWVRRG